MATSPDVLIIGAGPTGLTAAAEAIRHGLSVRVIDQNESRSIYSKALVVHSRSLEIFQDMGFAANVINSGQKFHALNIYAADKSLARIVFGELDWQDAIFPYWLSIPQSETERCLEHHLNELGGSVERQTELLNDHRQRRWLWHTAPGRRTRSGSISYSNNFPCTISVCFSCASCH